MFNEFYFRTMEFNYWRENQLKLVKEVRIQLDTFLRHRKVHLELDKILHPENLQIVQIDDESEFTRIAESFARCSSLEGEKRKLLVVEKNTLMLHMYAKGEVRAQQLTRLSYIRGGQLLPIPGPVLHYNANLELKTDIVQRVRIDPFRISSFRINQTTGKTSAVIMKGYTFQRQDRVEISHLGKIPLLFYAVKKLERHFIDCESDPFYKSLVQRLEKSCQLMREAPQQHLETATNCLKQARQPIVEVFTDDKRLNLLVQDLDSHLVKERRNKERNNSWQNLKSDEIPPIHPNSYD